MSLTRYTREELIEILNELGTTELATATSRYECATIAETGKSLFHLNLAERLSNGKVYRTRIKDFRDKSEDVTIGEENRSIYKKAQDLLEKLACDDELSDMAYQKELYKKDKNIYTSRSYLEFPLDKRLNSLYDDLSAVFLYYDNISTLKNNKKALVASYSNDKEALERFAKLHIESREEQKEFLSLGSTSKQVDWVAKKFGEDMITTFENIEDDKERLEFVKNNIEFTHCMLGGLNNPTWGIGVYGDLDPKFSGFNENQQVLPHEYCDFSKIRLSDTAKIKNNDLLQVMQSKIDIDKENLEVIDEKYVRGDIYKILKTNETMQISNGRTSFNYYIRYVCPSTGRVYFNPIVEGSLQQSRFYKSGDVKSYIHSWWHINNAGDDPTVELDVIRC